MPAFPNSSQRPTKLWCHAKSLSLSPGKKLLICFCFGLGESLKLSSTRRLKTNNSSPSPLLFCYSKENEHSFPLPRMGKSESKKAWDSDRPVIWEDQKVVGYGFEVPGVQRIQNTFLFKKNPENELFSACHRMSGQYRLFFLNIKSGEPPYLSSVAD